MTAYVLYRSGDTARAGVISRSLDAVPDSVWMIHMGRVFAALGASDTTKALREIEAALSNRELVTQWVPLSDRMFDPIRKSSRFAAILRKAGLEGRGLEKSQ